MTKRDFVLHKYELSETPTFSVIPEPLLFAAKDVFPNADADAKFYTMGNLIDERITSENPDLPSVSQTWSIYDSWYENTPVYAMKSVLVDSKLTAQSVRNWVLENYGLAMAIPEDAPYAEPYPYDELTIEDANCTREEFIEETKELISDPDCDNLDAIRAQNLTMVKKNANKFVPYKNPYWVYDEFFFIK